MRDVSGVKSSIVKNKGEGEGTATPFISAKNATASWAADLGYFLGDDAAVLSE